MMFSRRDTTRSLRANPVFAFYVLVTLGVAGYMGFMVGQMTLGIDVYLPGMFGQMTHGQTESHRVHDLTYAFIFTTGAVGVLAQLRQPARNVAGMLMALVPFAGLLLAAALVGEYRRILQFNPLYLVAAVSAVAAVLHPAGRDFFGSFRVSRVNSVMLALVAIAAVPLISFASTNIRLQKTVLDDHAFVGHYAFMAAFSFTVIGIGVLASLRPDGWRLPAWVAGLLPVLLGVTSLVFQDASSSLSVGWALAAIAWGTVFVATAELTKNTVGRTLLASRGVLSEFAGSESVVSR